MGRNTNTERVKLFERNLVKKMDATILTFTILTAVLAVIMGEETRDFRYISFLIMLGLAAVGSLLCVTDLGLTSEPIASITKSCLAVFAIISAFVFFRDMRSVNIACRGAEECYRNAIDLQKESSNFLLSSKEIRKEAYNTETAARNIITATTESVEGLQHG